MVKKLILSLLIVASVSTTIPIGASAAWKKDNGGLWYTQGETYSTGWRQIDGSWYYFGNDGQLYQNKYYTNWGNTYYFGADGSRYSNKFFDNANGTSYFDVNGGVSRSLCK